LAVFEGVNAGQLLIQTTSPNGFPDSFMVFDASSGKMIRQAPSPQLYMNSIGGYISNNNRAVLRLSATPDKYAPLATVDLGSLKVLSIKNLTMPQGISDNGGLLRVQGNTFTMMLSTTSTDPESWSFQLGLVNEQTGVVTSYMSLVDNPYIPSGIAMDPIGGNIMVIYYPMQSHTFRVRTLNLKSKSLVSDVAFPCPLYPGGMNPFKRAVQGSDTLVAVYHSPSKRLYTVVKTGIQMFDFASGTCTVVANASCSDFVPQYVQLSASDPNGNFAYLGMISPGMGPTNRYCFQKFSFSTGTPGWKSSVTPSLSPAPIFYTAMDIN